MFQVDGQNAAQMSRPAVRKLHDIVNIAKEKGIMLRNYCFHEIQFYVLF